MITRNLWELRPPQRAPPSSLDDNGGKKTAEPLRGRLHGSWRPNERQISR